jgi:hypothetical protein
LHALVARDVSPGGGDASTTNSVLVEGERRIALRARARGRAALMG